MPEAWYPYVRLLNSKDLLLFRLFVNLLNYQTYKER